MDNGCTETVQHHVSQNTGPQNAARVLQPVPVQLPAPASQQWLGYSSTISYARVSVLHPGGSCDASVDTVDTESHLEALTQHVAGCLTVPGASAAAEAKVLMESGSGISAMSEELVDAPAATAWDIANRVDAGVCRECTCDDVVGPGV